MGHMQRRGYIYRYKPTRKEVEEFKNKMNEVEEFLDKHPNVSASLSRDSFYFELNGQHYRVSNHSIEASNARAYDKWTHEQIREKYHDDNRDKDTFYIHASKTRIIEIYNAIASGMKVNGRGQIVA